MFSTAYCQDVITMANGGQLRGHTKLRSAIQGRVIKSYQGIPYAQPPVGDLRFAKPKPAIRWEGVLMADKQYKCPQVDMLLTNKVIGQEDCLYLNVYAPADGRVGPDFELLPVMVWIHGGGFFAGDGGTQLFGPERLLDKDIILVTINYRVGPLGFLTMLDDNLPANLGLFDQQMAFKWVQENIESFRGDRNRVTIFGESAGSASVLFHVLSPLSKGLFHAVIAQSGTPISTYLSLDKHPAYYARSVAASIGGDPNGTSAKIREALLKADCKDIVKNQFIDTSIQGAFPMRFIPVVDGDGGFIPKPPLEILESGEFNQVPIIMGYNKDEGLMVVWEYLCDQKKLEAFNSDMKSTLFGILTGRGSNADITKEENALAADVIQKDFGGMPIPNKLKGPMTKLMELTSDNWFNAIATKMALMLAKKNTAPVYEYRYEHMGTYSFLDFQMFPLWKNLLKIVGRLVGLDISNNRPGVYHADELFMLFKLHIFPFNSVHSEEDHQASANLLELWTTFAKTVGNPTTNHESKKVIWKRLSPEDPQRLSISSELKFGPRSEEETARLKRWEEVWERFPPGVYEKRQESWEQSAYKYSLNE